MTRPIIQRLKGYLSSAGLKGVLAAATIGIIPPSALAGHRNTDRYRDDRRTESRVDIDVRSGRDQSPQSVQETRVWVEPVYRTVCEQQWVAPVYRTDCERVWVAPVCQKITERVWVPDRYENRRIIHPNHFVSVERVLVQCAHYENVQRDVVITPGHYEDIPHQVLVCDGHYQPVERQELIAPGHWETRCDPVAVNHREEPQSWFSIHLPLRW